MWPAIGLAASAAILAATGAGWMLSHSRRGPARVAWYRASVVGTVVGTALAMLTLPSFIAISMSDAIGIVGIVVSLALGFLSGAVANRTMKPLVGVAIPSRVAFHRELRAGLRSALGEATIIDEYESSVAAREDLSDFLPLLRRTAAKKPDYLVICAPGIGTSAQPEVSRIVEDLASRGGAVFAIEAGDFSDLDQPARSRVSIVRSDARPGVEALIAYLRGHAPAVQRILIISGPSTSKPAGDRAREFATALPNAQVVGIQGSGWTAESAVAALEQYRREQGALPEFIIAGNDEMALGCSRHLTDVPRGRSVRVIGFDGTLPALVSIADASSTFVATVRVPPKQYGEIVGGRIASDFARPAIKPRTLPSTSITTDASHLVTKTNVWNYFQ